MDYSSDNLFSKKNIITYLILAILILAIPLGVNLVHRQQQLKTRAATAEIKFSGDGVSCDTTGSCTTTKDTVTIELTSPYGPGGQSQTQ